MLILCLDQASQEYYISATQSHDKSKAIQYKNRPFQILIFTGFSESQNKVEPYRKKSMFIRVYGILAVKFCTIFVIYLTIYSYTNPLKIRIYTIPWSIPWNTCKYMQSLINTAISALQNVIILFFFNNIYLKVDGGTFY